MRVSRCSGSRAAEDASLLVFATWDGSLCSKTIWTARLITTEKASTSHGLPARLRSARARRRVWRRWLEQEEKHSGRCSCGERRRAYTKQRTSEETPTSSPRLTLAFPLCARAWERKGGRRRGTRVE